MKRTSVANGVSQRGSYHLETTVLLTLSGIYSQWEYLLSKETNQTIILNWRNLSALKKCAVMHMWFLYEKMDFSCRLTQLVWDDHSLLVAWWVVSNECDGSAGLKMQWYGIWIGDLPRLLMVKLEIPHEHQRDFIQHWWYYPLQQSSVSMCGIAQIICFFSWAGTPSLCSKLTRSGA